jgi:hypothetical protein
LQVVPAAADMERAVAAAAEVVQEVLELVLHYRLHQAHHIQ